MNAIPPARFPAPDLPAPPDVSVALAPAPAPDAMRIVIDVPVAVVLRRGLQRVFADLADWESVRAEEQRRDAERDAVRRYMAARRIEIARAGRAAHRACRTIGGTGTHERRDRRMRVVKETAARFGLDPLSVDLARVRFGKRMRAWRNARICRLHGLGVAAAEIANDPLVAAVSGRRLSAKSIGRIVRQHGQR